MTFLILLLMYYFFVMDKMELIIINVIVIGITIGFTVFINKARPEGSTNVMIQIGFSFVLILAFIMFTFITIFDDGENVSLKQENLPLLISDYRECTDKIDDIDYYHDRNFLGSMDVYYIFGEENSIYYHIYESENIKILNKIWEEELNGKKINEDAVDCTTDWEAQQAIRNKLGTYYVRYDNKILVFSDDEDVYLSVDQINMIRDKLNLR